MYQSPISLIQKDVESKIDDAIMMAVQKVGVTVDKNELLRALMYDREQYEKGYRDGLNDAVRHGRWISVPHKRDRICSICDCDEPYKFADENAHVFDYCPHCGARMDEVL